VEYLAIQSDAPGTERLVLVDGPPYDPWVVIGDIDVGSAQWETTFGAPHGTRGAMVAGDRVGNRQVVMTLRGSFSSKAEAAGYENELALALDECRRFGGWLIYRVHGGTRRTWWRVLAREYGMEPWGQRFDRVNELRPRLVLTVEPYPYGDPMDHATRFDDAAALAAHTLVPVGNGVIGSLTTGDGLGVSTVAGAPTYYLIHTDTGYDLGDTEARASLTLAAVNNTFEAGVVLKYIDAQNLLLCAVEGNGGSWRLNIWQQVAGSWTSLATQAISTPNAGTPYWVQGRIEGGVVKCEWGVGNLPFTPTATATAQLSGAALTALGPTGRGKAGLYWKPINTGDRIRRFMVDPFTYTGVTRYPLEVCGDVPGTAPALLNVAMSAPVAGTPWLMLGWAAKPQPWNRIHNEGFEVGGGGLIGGDNVGWSVAAVTGVTGAASSVARSTNAAFEGTAAGQVTTPATANTGAHYRLAARFERGRTYRFRLMVRSGTGTTNVRIRLGVNGDIASSTAAALSTTWTEHTVDWTPSTSVNIAYAAVEVTAATATIFQIDRAQVYLAQDGAPNRRGIGHAGRAPWGLIDGLAGFTATGAPTSATLSSEPYAQLDLSVSSLGESYAIAWALDPTLIPQDDHAGPTRDVEVWARLVMSSAFDGGVTALLSVAGEVYTYEWGSDGCKLVMPNGVQAFRIYRLGTIPLPDLVGDTGSTLLQLGFDVAAGTNNVAIGVDWIWLTNPRARVLTPTGIDADQGYPHLPPDGVVNEHGLVTGIRDNNHRHVGTLSGGVELPTGPVEFALLNSNAVPDAPTAAGIAPYTVSGSETFDTPRLHLSVRPRFEFLIAEE